jgi:hypothetical protein
VIAQCTADCLLLPLLLLLLVHVICLRCIILAARVQLQPIDDMRQLLLLRHLLPPASVKQLW